MRRGLRCVLAAWFLSACSAAQALTSAQEIILFGAPGWVLPGARVDLNFATGQYWTPGAAGALTNTRASTETCVDASGVWHQAASGQNCVTNLGVGSWEARTNGIRNNTMQGAVAGSPGTLPNNWVIGFNGNGLSSSIIGSGVQNGINYVDININGTAVNANQIYIGLESATNIAAAYGQTWTASSFMAFVGGVTTNISSVSLGINEREGGNGGTGNFITYIAVGSLPSSASGKPYVLSGTFTDPLATYAWPILGINPASTGVFNFTLRVGLPQLELNPNIPASVASAVVTAGGTGGTNGTNVNLTVTGGTCSTQPVIQGTIAGNALTAITGYGTPGACSVLPPSPATVTGNSLSGATVTLTPTNNAALAFATPPILTSGSAATRAADNISLATQPCANPSVLLTATPAAPTGYPATQRAAIVNNASNGLALDRGGTGAALLTTANIGGNNYAAQPAGSWAQSALGKLSTAYAPNTVSGVFNNGTVVSTATTGAMGGVTSLNIGDDKTGASQFNGVISRAAVACGSSLLRN